ncbi:BRCT domain-containing protein [Corynebacterium sp. UMB4614]|uniref:BRCT domain-containing protein n=1 Tax=Corynebacterium sp. UMB4614 TaxID=3046334 RepID=UPI00254FE82B|nr:BRCT domain-containing protein [Corynebacterium sp. UMB4614]MDK7134075.1 BRCT domain-containing protein [Corynebacterium sp. UMB4614]
MTDSSITITSDGIQVHRSLLARSLSPDLAIASEQLLGWRISAPTASSPGWLHFLLAGASTNGFIRSFDEARLNPATVHFFPGEAEMLTEIDEQLSRLQAGFDVDVATIDAAEWSASFESDAPAAGSSAAPAAAPTSSSTKKTPKKSGNRRAPWDRVATPDKVPEQNTEADVDGPVFGETVVITGDVEPYSKGEVWDMLADAGAIVAKNVTKKTTLLILGEWATVTSKEKRARELQEQGQELAIWTFEELLQKLGVQG